jgi:hypothetical protein
MNRKIGFVQLLTVVALLVGLIGLLSAYDAVKRDEPFFF